MGLFDIFKSGNAEERKRERALKTLLEKYAQKADRLAAAEMLTDLAASGDTESVRCLLKRFEYMTASSTQDREEKEYVRALLVDLGDLAIEPIKDYVSKTTSPVYWPVRVLEDVMSKSAMASFMVAILRDMDNGYWRDPEKKLGLVQISTEFPSDELPEAIAPFLEDHHEELRFAAIDALSKLDSDAGREFIIQQLGGEEDSKRLQVQLCDHVISRGWKLTDEEAETLSGHIPDGYALKGNQLVPAK